MNLEDVMAEVAGRLEAIEGLRVADHPVDAINPPHAIVALPEITFDLTYGRGCDRYRLPVVVAVGKASDRASVKKLAGYVKGSGATSVKQALEDETTPYVAFDTLRVESVDFDVIAWGAVEYLTAAFTLDIVGSGA
ncbi:MAG TPA: hypothetical protein VIQ30_18860 [Pseudonocardia sp.]